MKGRPGAGKDVTRIELHAKFSLGEMEVNFLNNVFATMDTEAHLSEFQLFWTDEPMKNYQ